jgi:hypothetical protein
MVGMSVALGTMAYRVMPGLAPPSVRYALAALASVLLTVGLSSFWSLARGQGRGKRAPAALLQRARSGETPEDGQPMIATGKIEPLSTPLIAPLTGIPCVGYQYRMYYRGRRAGSRHATDRVPVYWGSASQPFALRSDTSVRTVRAVPLMASVAESRKDAITLDRARQLIQTTSFEATAANPRAGLGTAFEMINDVFTDDDGEVRRDWKRAGDERDPKDLILGEIVLPVGALASVHGTWSSARDAIVSDLASDSPGVTIVLGPPEALRGTPGDTHSFGAYLMGAVVLTALGAGVIWLGVNVLSKVPGAP